MLGYTNGGMGLANGTIFRMVKNVIYIFDWSDCALVEIYPLRLGGRPVVKGTRMAADDIVANYEHGVSKEEISAQFRIPTKTITDLLDYARSHPPVVRSVP